MLGKSRKPIIAISLAIVIIVIFAVVGMVGPQLFAFPRYQLGMKEVLLSDLKEYFAREPEIAVRIENETALHAENAVEYRYDLISVVDFEGHGRLGMVAGSDGRVGLLYLMWTHDGNVKLRESGYLMLSGIADHTIPDWQNEDGQANRNVQMLETISANSDSSGSYETWDLSERRMWSSSITDSRIGASVQIEP